jgi:hypothetical protein
MSTKGLDHQTNLSRHLLLLAMWRILDSASSAVRAELFWLIPIYIGAVPTGSGKTLAAFLV